MPVHVALLRSVNTGKRKVLKEDLLGVAQDTGFPAAKTYLASGNLLLWGEDPGGPALEARLEDALAALEHERRRSAQRSAVRRWGAGCCRRPSHAQSSATSSFAKAVPNRAHAMTGLHVAVIAGGPVLDESAAVVTNDGS